MSKAPHLEAFLEAARYYQGVESIYSSFGQEMAATAGFPGYTGAWCAVYVMACAARAGILGTVIGRDPYAYAIEVERITVDYCNGEWIEGPAVNGGVAVTPIPGDLITFGWEPYYTGYEHASHIGIVEYVQDGKVHTLEGNKGGSAGWRECALDFGCINMYVRPDWSKVGDDISAYLAEAGLGYNLGPLYKIKNDRHDMTMREVGYIDSKYQFTNSPSDIKLSIINYTTTLGELYDMFAPVASGIIVDTSQLTGNTRIVMDYLLKMGFNAADAAGVTAAIHVISAINTMFYDSAKEGNKTIYFYGICGWDYETKERMRKRLGTSWATSLSGQLEFLLDELSSSRYQGLLKAITSGGMTASSAKLTAQTFLANYNKHYNTIKNVTEAKKQAEDIFSKVIIKQVSVGNNLDNLRNENGELLSAQFSVDIPDSVPQSGIVNDYTSYSHFYHRWSAGTTQRTLADIWYYQGCPYDMAIATISGYYCIAVSPKFGRCGDVVVVTLEDNSYFAAIIADVKGSDATSEWGHVENGRVKVIEWEKIVTYDGQVQTEGTSAVIVDNPGFGEWYGQRVINITNYGSYL